MIKEHTVFILGAGASKPFGFPLGSELVDLIFESLKYKPITERKKTESGSIMTGPLYCYEPINDDTKSANPLFQMLLDQGHKKDEVLKFRQDLIESQLNSVDAFLEHRVEYIPIGKAAIAYNLLNYESKEALYSTPDWYKYIWNVLNTSWDEFTANQVSFITFNYDRSLEYYLLNSIKATFGKTIRESQTMLEHIPIIHLHGKLGDLPWEAEDRNIPFGHKIINSDELQHVAQSIKIIHEDIEQDKEFTLANQVLKSAKKVYILGFGFSPTNISRLKLNEIEPISVCTSYGLTPTEIKRINSVNPKLRVSASHWYGSLDFLRHHALLQ
jgi:hypothetical protein